MTGKKMHEMSNSEVHQPMCLHLNFIWENALSRKKCTGHNVYTIVN